MYEDIYSYLSVIILMIELPYFEDISIIYIKYIYNTLFPPIKNVYKNMYSKHAHGSQQSFWDLSCGLCFRIRKG